MHPRSKLQALVLFIFITQAHLSTLLNGTQVNVERLPAPVPVPAVCRIIKISFTCRNPKVRAPANGAPRLHEGAQPLKTLRSLVDVE